MMTFSMIREPSGNVTVSVNAERFSPGTTLSTLIVSGDRHTPRRCSPISPTPVMT